MQLISHTKPKMIISDVGKQIRSVDDVYVPEHIDDEDHVIPEHFPYYATTIFVPDGFTEEKINELYVEEEIEKE